MLSLVQIESSPSASTPSTAHRAAKATQVVSLSSKMQAPARPARAISRTYPAVPLPDNSDDSILERQATTTAFDAGDLECSRPVTPVEVGLDDNDDENDDNDSTLSTHSHHHSGDLGTDDEDGGVEVLQSLWHPRKNTFRMAIVALNTFNNGLNDSAAGALLPYIERHYGIGYGVVSLIFVACAFGSIMAATVVDPLKRRLGRARTLCIAQLIMALGFVPMLTTVAPFPVAAVGFFAVGLGEAINVAIGNTYCAGLQQGTAALGAMHGSYGIGGISGPLIATAIAVATGAAAEQSENDKSAAVVFGRYYLLPFGLCVLTAVLSAWAFTGYERDWGEIRESRPRSSSSSSSSSAASSASHDTAERRRRWQLGRQRQEELQQQQQQQREQLQQQAERPSWDRKLQQQQQPPAIQLTEFTTSLPQQQTQPVSQPLTAASSSRPILSTLQSQSPSEALATPSHSFASSTTPIVNADPPAIRPANAQTASTRRHRRSRTQRTKNRLYDMFTAPSSRIILLGAMFLFMYQGAEVSIAGWVTSFLMADRGGTEPAVGYITAGFWAGITLGRFALAVPAQRIGPRRFVYGCVVGSAVFELLVWFVPNVVGDAVAVAVVGLLLGPVYPCAAGLFMRGLSRRERVSGVSAIAAFGSAGGAAAPFVTGVLAQAVGTFVLHPIVIALFAAMLVFWYLVPSPPKPRE